MGDDPPRGSLALLSRFLPSLTSPLPDRTAELRKLGFPTRHLGPMQMTTDTALGVTKLVVQDQSPSLSSPNATLTDTRPSSPHRQDFLCREPHDPVRRDGIGRDAVPVRRRRAGGAYLAAGDAQAPSGRHGQEL
mgnify:FL=1